MYDSADLDAAPALVERVESELGPLDVLVTNTGGPPGNPDALGFERDQWEAAYRTLVLSPMALIEAALPGMRERGFGRILNVVSSAVREPIPNLMLSNAHRASMLAAFKTVARQVAGDGVTLNSALPGRIATARLGELMGSLEQAEEQASRGGTRRPAGDGRGVRRRCGLPVLGPRELHHGRGAARGRRAHAQRLAVSSRLGRLRADVYFRAAAARPAAPGCAASA